MFEWRHPYLFNFHDSREDAQVKFPRISGKSSLPESYYEVESSLKSKKWNQERLVDEIRREQSFLDQAKFNFEIKKKEFVRFLAQSSQYAPAQYAPAQVFSWLNLDLPIIYGIIDSLKTHYNNHKHFKKKLKIISRIDFLAHFHIFTASYISYQLCYHFYIFYLQFYI